ncbi:MAG: diguanylate cyclase [Gallionella sp.]|nr:diguanylate cyclase [Gallionella sp.]
MIRNSLHNQLFLVLLIAMVPVFTVHEIIVITSEIRTANEHTAGDTQSAAAAAIPMLKSALIVGDLATAQETLDNIMRHGQFRRLHLLDPSGRNVLAEGKMEADSVAGSPPDWFVNWLDFRFGSQEFPVVAGGMTYGSLVAEPSSLFLVSDIWKKIWTALITWVASLIFFVILLRVTLRRGLRPLEDLAAIARRFGEGDLQSRATVSNVPELAETAIAFNTMAERLADAQGRLEGRISQALHELDSLINRIPAGVYKLRMLADGGMRFDFVSPRWCELLEVQAEDVYRDVGVAISRLHPDEVETFTNLHESVRKSMAPFHWEGRLRDGMRVRWIHIESTPTKLDNGDILWEGIQYDITATKEHEEELNHTARYDILTDLPNRLLLTDRLQQAMAQASRRGTKLALVYLDLDGFKAVNDNCGHDAGDRLLIAVSNRMKHTLREGDTLARMGGDEFVAVLIDLPDNNACIPMLTRLLDAGTEQVVCKECNLNVSASLGVTFFPQVQEITAESLLLQADQAMYRAKLAGKGCYRFFEDEA